MKAFPAPRALHVGSGGAVDPLWGRLPAPAHGSPEDVQLCSAVWGVTQEKPFALVFLGKEGLCSALVNSSFLNKFCKTHFLWFLLIVLPAVGVPAVSRGRLLTRGSSCFSPLRVLVQHCSCALSSVTLVRRGWSAIPAKLGNSR